LRSVKIFIITSLVGVLTACVIHAGNNIANLMFKAKLNDGTSVEYGNRFPPAAWQCERLAQNAYKWSSMVSKGAYTHIRGGYGELQSKALNYASEQQLKINYIFYSTPEVTTLPASDPNSQDQIYAHLYYYQCAKLNPY